VIPRALAEGEIEVLGLMPDSSNDTLLTRCRSEDQECFAIYKPARGEAPLWDFPDGTLHRREVAAYVVADALGWPNVPPTVLRDGPMGPGSLQLFVRFDATEHYFTLGAERADDFRRIAMFDIVVNNADRKAGHCLLGEDGAIWVIDHGVCFSDEPKLRTVIWDFIDEPIPRVLADDLARFGAGLVAGGATRRALEALLAPAEVDATAERLDRLVASGRFPEPEPGVRPIPWPPI
jgi:Phosphatidylinositol 3- and 4-kinase